MRTSRPSITNEQALAIEAGYPIRVKDWSGGGHQLKVRSLKNKNRTAYDRHLCEVEIDGRRTVVNVDDLTKAIRYV